jgi:hypothetical protein
MLSLVLQKSRLVLLGDFVSQRFRGEHFYRRAMFGDIEQ